MTKSKQARIVVAEEDLDILYLVVKKLTEAGLKTIAVPDVIAALSGIEPTLRGWLSSTSRCLG